ncbi:MAG: thioredoxin-disulfide reductase [Clostridia bacterium]|nr:thioredoxin-disulfide reductase [Clostridia bacterium]
MSRIYDTVVIGGGPAGYTAALYAARARLSVLVLERMAAGGQMTLTGEIENYPGIASIDGFTLGMQMQERAEHFGAVTEYTEVTAVDLAADPKRIDTWSGEFYGKTVIIATGADPRRLGLAEEEDLVGRGVHYCAHCDGRFYKDKTVLLVGGGNSAAADALYLSRVVRKVILVHRRDTLRATKIYHEPLMQAENVEFCWNSRVAQILSDKTVTGAILENTQTGEQTEVACDGVFISIGRQPATAFLQGQVALDDAGYIVAGETTETNVPGVFAAGDVRTKSLRQVVTAAADGAVAADMAEKYL